MSSPHGYFHATGSADAGTCAFEIRPLESYNSALTLGLSMTNGTVMRTTMIATELLTNIHEQIRDLGHVPCLSGNTFNI